MDIATELERTLSAPPGEPPHRDLDGLLADAHSRLRRRRVTLAGGVAVLALVVGIGAVALVSPGSDASRSIATDPSGGPSSDPGVVPDTGADTGLVPGAWPRIHRRGDEEAYVRRIIVRTTIDEHRRPWRRERVGLPEAEPPAEPGLALEERDALVAALQELPEMQRKTVLLRHWLGLSVEGTAAELGIATGTVKSHTSRAMQRLEELLASPERAS